MPIEGTQNLITVNPRSYMGMHIYLTGKWESEVSNFVLALSNKKINRRCRSSYRVLFLVIYKHHSPRGKNNCIRAGTGNPGKVIAEC